MAWAGKHPSGCYHKLRHCLLVPSEVDDEVDREHRRVRNRMDAKMRAIGYGDMLYSDASRRPATDSMGNEDDTEELYGFVCNGTNGTGCDNELMFCSSAYTTTLGGLSFYISNPFPMEIDMTSDTSGFMCDVSEKFGISCVELVCSECSQSIGCYVTGATSNPDLCVLSGTALLLADMTTVSRVE